MGEYETYPASWRQEWMPWRPLPRKHAAAPNTPNASDNGCSASVRSCCGRKDSMIPTSPNASTCTKKMWRQAFSRSNTPVIPMTTTCFVKWLTTARGLLNPVGGARDYMVHPEMYY